MEIQPQGREFDYFRLMFDFYKALRSLGLSIDIKSSRDNDFSGYKLVAVPACSPGRRVSWRRWRSPAQASSSAAQRIEDAGLFHPLAASAGAARRRAGPQGHADRDAAMECPVALDAMPVAFQFWREFVDVGPACEVLVKTTDGNPRC